MKAIALILASLIAIAAILSGGYILIFWGIIEPILDICKAIDAHQVTASLIGWAVVKFLVRDLLAAFVIIIGLGIAAGIAYMAD